MYKAHILPYGRSCLSFLVTVMAAYLLARHGVSTLTAVILTYVSRNIDAGMCQSLFHVKMKFPYYVIYIVSFDRMNDRKTACMLVIFKVLIKILPSIPNSVCVTNFEMNKLQDTGPF